MLAGARGGDWARGLPRLGAMFIAFGAEVDCEAGHENDGDAMKVVSLASVQLYYNLMHPYRWLKLKRKRDQMPNIEISRGRLTVR